MCIGVREAADGRVACGHAKSFREGLDGTTVIDSTMLSVSGILATSTELTSNGTDS